LNTFNTSNHTNGVNTVNTVKMPPGASVNLPNASNASIRVGIAEDQALVRESLAIVLNLEADLQVQWTAASGVDALRQMEQSPVDVVLTDLRMPLMDGVATTKQLKQLRPGVQVIVLTTFHHDEWLLDALKAGAAACLLKDVPPSLLADAIRLIRIGAGTWEPSAWSPDWRLYAPDIQFQARAVGRDEHGFDTLTARDVELLRMICSGDSNGEMAHKLHLSEGTIKNYVSALYAKLGVRHRHEAIRIARERGIS